MGKSYGSILRAKIRKTGTKTVLNKDQTDTNNNDIESFVFVAMHTYHYGNVMQYGINVIVVSGCVKTLRLLFVEFEALKSMFGVSYQEVRVEFGVLLVWVGLWGLRGLGR